MSAVQLKAAMHTMYAKLRSTKEHRYYHASCQLRILHTLPSMKTCNFGSSFFLAIETPEFYD